MVCDNGAGDAGQQSTRVASCRAGSRRGRCERWSAGERLRRREEWTRWWRPVAETSWWTCSSRCRSMVVAHYLGVPAADRGRFDGWTDAIVAASSTGDQLGRRRRRGGAARSTSRRWWSGAGTTPATTPSRTWWRRGWPETDDVDGLVGVLGYVFTMVTAATTPPPATLGGGVQLLAQRARPERLGWQPIPTRSAGRSRGAAAAHLAGAGTGAHHHPRRRAARRHDPGR